MEFVTSEGRFAKHPANHFLSVKSVYSRSDREATSCGMMLFRHLPVVLAWSIDSNGLRLAS